MSRNRPYRSREKRAPTPLSASSLEELALAYVARFSTSAARLESYLSRKLRERGWAGGGQDEGPDESRAESLAQVGALIERFVENGYVDDAAYARARSGDLLRRGYGANRVNQALGQAGIAESVRADVAPLEAARRRAALHLARKRGFGPFALQAMDRQKREKAIAAMLRAGHSFDHARALIDAESEARAQEWASEAEESEDDGFA